MDLLLDVGLEPVTTIVEVCTFMSPPLNLETAVGCIWLAEMSVLTVALVTLGT